MNLPEVILSPGDGHGLEASVSGACASWTVSSTRSLAGSWSAFSDEFLVGAPGRVAAEGVGGALLAEGFGEAVA